MDFRTNRQRVEGLGTAHDGVGHWWGQRLTSIALVPLTLFFVFPFARTLGADWETVLAVYGRPLNAIVRRPGRSQWLLTMLDFSAGMPSTA